MTTGALIFFIVFCIAFGLFGIYAGLHRKDDSEEQNLKAKKNNHA